MGATVGPAGSRVVVTPTGGTPVERFAYPLPDAAIAQVPSEPRDGARMLVDRGPRRHPDDRGIRDLPALLDPGDLLVVNDTRVLPARLRAIKVTGGAVEVLLLEREPTGTWRAFVRPGRRVPPGTRVTAGGLAVDVGEEVGDGVRRVRLVPGAGARSHARADADADVDAHVVADANTAADAGADGSAPADAEAELRALAVEGEVPLPPYVHVTLDDPERYQTVYARTPGSVAAPTAGLHLTRRVLDEVRDRGIRVETIDLAVGLGTFRPLAAETVEAHRMHEEAYRVAPEVLDACHRTRAHHRRVVAVGTTTLRALEAAAASGRTNGRTDLYIHGDHRFGLVDGLLTNFHIPRSSLLVLVDAFVGPRWRGLYDHARASGYRFLSFGDCCLLDHRWGRVA